MDERRFHFRGGRLCVDFTATLSARYRGGVEGLATPADLAQWCATALALDGGFVVTAAQLRHARALREAIYRLLHPAGRDDPDPADVLTLNTWSTKRDLAPALGTDARTLIVPGNRTVEAALATVARDAVALLSSPALDRVRECAVPDCSLLFVDESRAGRRRWCDMGVCGNRVKAREYRRRRPAGSS